MNARKTITSIPNDDLAQLLLLLLENQFSIDSD